MDKNISRSLRVIGTPADVAEFEKSILPYNVEIIQECHVRKIIQDILDDRNINVTVLYAGNTVYGVKKLVADLKRITKAGDMGRLSDRLYKFLSLACGSIAHYNKLGWIATYPNVDDLKRFFRCNEMGQSVLDYQPIWATDRITVVKALNKVLKV